MLHKRVKTLATTRKSGAMEPETIKKNWASLKSQMSRENFLLRY